MGLLRTFSTTFHLMANHLCATDGDAATGEVYCMAHHLIESADGTTDLVMYIRYRDAYARTGEGWRFARRDVMRQWTEERPAGRRPLDV
jgi:SnoaL-like domain